MVPFGAGAEELAKLLSRRHPWLRVTAADGQAPALAWRWEDLRARQRAGGDPTAGWREALAASTRRRYGRPAPPAMPAAFVLQWALEVPATVAAQAAVLGPWAVDLSPGSLSFALDPAGLFPSHIQVSGVHPARADAEGRIEQARADYLRLVEPFAEHYRPGVRLGPHQKRAMVQDVWALAVHRAQGPHGAPAPVERGACCFIYSLPGAHECAGCPRLRRFSR